MPHPQIHLQRTYWRTNNETQNQCIFFNLVVLVMEPLVVYTDILIWLKISDLFRSKVFWWDLFLALAP